MNESEMSLGYVKKKAESRTSKTRLASNETTTGLAEGVTVESERDFKTADTRAGKTIEQAPVEEPVLKTASENLEEFMTNSERTWASVDTVLNDEAYKAEGLLEEYKHLPVKKASLEAESNETTKTLGYLEFDENNNIIGIVIDSNLSKDDAEFVLLHEIRHAQQLKEQSKEAIEELVQKTKEGDPLYYYSSLEKEADEYAVNMINKKKDYYEQQRTNVNARDSQNNGVINKTELGSSKTGSDNNRGNSSIRRPEAQRNGLLQDGQTGNSAADTRATHERLSEANTIQDVENILDETVKSDKTIKNRTFAEFMEDGQVQYDKLREKFGDNLLGIKEAIIKNDRTLSDEICARQAAAEKLISDFQQKIIELDETETIPYIEAVNALTKWNKEISSSLNGFISFYINNIFTQKTALVNLVSGHFMSFYYPM